MSRESDELFALRVHGDSMMDDHITDGDIVVAISQDQAEDGGIVAALIDGEVTVRRMDSQLSPDSARILGRVIGLFRVYETT